MSEFKVNTITNRDGSGGPQVCGITTFGSSGLTLPGGPTEMRGGRGRAVFAGGSQQPSGSQWQNVIDKVEIATTGNATDFGDMDQGRYYNRAVSSSVRGVIAGGTGDGTGSPAMTSNMQYVTISSDGGSNDFGEMDFARNGLVPASNNTRGLLAAGYVSPANIRDTKILFITIPTTGNSNGFGSLSEAQDQGAGINSPTRGVFAGCKNPARSDVISFVTISTLGNAEDFGNLTTSKGAMPGASSSTRGLIFGGDDGSNFINNIDLITIPTLGDATDFGDLLAINAESTAASSQIRGLCAGGETPTGGGWTNVIQYVTIATAGNAVDFGDLTVARGNDLGGFSDAHGGLSQ